MSTYPYSVETRGQAAIVIGGNNSLVPWILQDFKSRGIYAISLTTPADLTTLGKTHDLDYLLILEDDTTSSWLTGEGRTALSPLQTLIQSGQTRLILARHYTRPSPELSLGPVTTHLLYSDYLGVANFVSPTLTAWISSLTSLHNLVIPGDGLTEIGILGARDLALGLVMGATRPHKLGENLLLTSDEPISLLNLAYHLRSLLPFKVTLSFDQNQIPPLTLPGEETPRLSWDQTAKLPDLLDSLAKTISPTPLASAPKSIALPPPPLPVTQTSATRLTRLAHPTPIFVPLQDKKHLPFSLWTKLKTALHRSPPNRLVDKAPRPKTIIGRGLLIALGLYLGSLAFAMTISVLSLKQIIRSLGVDALPTSTLINRAATTYLEANLVAYSLLPRLGETPFFRDGLLLLDAYQQLLTILDTTGALSHSTSQLLASVLGHGQADIVKLISLARLESETLYQELSLLDGTLPSTPPSLLPSQFVSTYQINKARLSKLKRSVLMTKAVLSTTPDLIGLGGRRKYAVLFQNNMELRATGGFIGSFAILSFENGELYDMPVYDVYAADGQLKGHVEPPLPIKDILGEANWYLRDSNFDPDFPTSARRAEWFIQKTLNQTLDGTFALNVNSLSDLLEATGPLTVTDYNEEITAGNLYERAQFHAEVNFFPGSTQKKEFLSSVGNAIFARLSTVGAGEGFKLAEALLHGVDAKNTLVSVNDPTSEHVFATLGWSGALQAPEHSDYAMVVDSNFGINKANYFIRRDIQAVITLNKNLTVDHVLRLRYTNTSTSNAWPAGVYKNYQRIYLPPGSSLTHLKVGDQLVNPRSYTVSSEHNKTVISHLLSIPINSTLGIELEYQTPASTGGDEPTYSWYWQKQSGTSSLDPLTVYLNYPMYLKPSLISPPAELAIQQLKFNLHNETDHRLSVKFSQ